MNPKQRKERAQEVKRCQKAATKKRNQFRFNFAPGTGLRFLPNHNMEEPSQVLYTHYVPEESTYQARCDAAASRCGICLLIDEAKAAEAKAKEALV